MSAVPFSSTFCFLLPVRYPYCWYFPRVALFPFVQPRRLFLSIHHCEASVLTGMRIGELLALRWRNVDFGCRVIRVREAVYEGHNSTPKTQGSIRDVPMGPALEQALRQHGARRRTQMIHSSSPVVTEVICDQEICTSATCIRHARGQSSDVSVGMTSDERMRRCLARWANP